MYKMNTKEISAKQILATIELNLEFLKNLKTANFNNDTLEDDLARVSEMLEKTQNSDLTVDSFIDELENFCKYSMNESIKSDNVYTLDAFHEFVYIVDTQFNA